VYSPHIDAACGSFTNFAYSSVFTQPQNAILKKNCLRNTNLHVIYFRFKRVSCVSISHFRIALHHLWAWASEGVFPGEGYREFFKNFFRGTKVVKFEISHSKLKKQPFAVIFKNQRRAKPPPATPLSDAHTCETKCDFSALRCIKNYSDQGATSSSFRGGQFSWNFIRWRHCAYSTVVQLFRKRSHIKILYFCPQTRSP